MRKINKKDVIVCHGAVTHSMNQPCEECKKIEKTWKDFYNKIKSEGKDLDQELQKIIDNNFEDLF